MPGIRSYVYTDLADAPPLHMQIAMYLSWGMPEENIKLVCRVEEVTVRSVAAHPPIVRWIEAQQQAIQVETYEAVRMVGQGRNQALIETLQRIPKMKNGDLLKAVTLFCDRAEDGRTSKQTKTQVTHGAAADGKYLALLRERAATLGIRETIIDVQGHEMAGVSASDGEETEAEKRRYALLEGY